MLPAPVVSAMIPEYEELGAIELVTIVSEPAMLVLLLATVPPEPFKPPTARLNVLTSNTPPLTVTGPVPVAPLVIEEFPPLPLVADEIPINRVPLVTVVPSL